MKTSVLQWQRGELLSTRWNPCFLRKGSDSTWSTLPACHLQWCDPHLWLPRASGAVLRGTCTWKREWAEWSAECMWLDNSFGTTILLFFARLYRGKVWLHCWNGPQTEVPHVTPSHLQLDVDSSMASCDLFCFTPHMAFVFCIYKCLIYSRKRTLVSRHVGVKIHRCFIYGLKSPVYGHLPFFSFFFSTSYFKVTFSIFSYLCLHILAGGLHVKAGTNIDPSFSPPFHRSKVFSHL